MSMVMGAYGYEMSLYGLGVSGAGLIEGPFNDPKKPRGDELTFVYQEVEGDTEITARITGDALGCVGNGRAGVMFREKITSGSRHAAATIGLGSPVFNAEGKPTYQGTPLSLARVVEDGAATKPGSVQGRALPIYVRVLRKGNTFQMSYSIDAHGADWIEAGEVTLTNAAKSFNAGIFVASKDYKRCEVFIDRIRVRSTFLPAPWDERDIRKDPSDVLPGTTMYSKTGQNEKFVLTGVGGGFENNTDPGFYFASRPVGSSYDFVARLVKVDGPGAGGNARVGLIHRENFGGNSTHTAIWHQPEVRAAEGDAGQVVVSPGRGMVTNRRAASDAIKPEVSEDCDKLVPPIWFRLLRGPSATGDEFAVFYSKSTNAPKNDSEWKVLAIARGERWRKENISPGYVGLFVASGDTENTVRAEFDNVKLDTTPAKAPSAFTVPERGQCNGDGGVSDSGVSDGATGN